MNHPLLSTLRPFTAGPFSRLAACSGRDEGPSGRTLFPDADSVRREARVLDDVNTAARFAPLGGTQGFTHAPAADTWTVG